MQIDPIAAVSLLVAVAALVFSIVSFRRSEQLNTQVALQTHLAEQKNAIKKIWHESKPVIEQISQILGSGYCLTDIGKTLNSVESKDAGCILHGAVTLYLFSKLAEAYMQGDYQKIEQ